MHIEQIYDDGLAQASYIILSNGEAALIDPARDTKPYLEFVKEHQANIVAVLETHPHADFASSHLEFQQKHGIKIYTHPKSGVSYPYEPLEDGDEVKIGGITLRALFTPGHSPDHHAYLLLDERGIPSRSGMISGKKYAIFTGDALFVGDVGRPDLREGAGHINMPKEALASLMFDTVQHVFKPLNDEVMVYPAHGAGSACGKNMSSEETFSTIGKERKRNWAMQENDKQAFVETLLEGQTHIPRYFPYAVEQNRKGFASLADSLQKVKRLDSIDALQQDSLLIDVRPVQAFKSGHLPGAINIPDGGKFETWLGTLIAPDESFYLLADNETLLETVMYKSAKIGYESLLAGVVVVQTPLPAHSTFADKQDLQENPQQFTIIDVRNEEEVEQHKIFADSLNIPLTELRDKAQTVPTNKPIAVHCAGGYRSAIASSILEKQLGQSVSIKDIGEAIKTF